MPDPAYNSRFIEKKELILILTTLWHELAVA